MIKIYLLFVVFMCSFFSSSAQLILDWNKCFGGNSSDECWTFAITKDNGFAVAARWLSDPGVNSCADDNKEIWITKLSSTGNIQWQQCLGGSKQDFPKSIIQTSDGGYIVALESKSSDGDFLNNYGYDDIWIVKLSSSGSVLWKRHFGGSYVDLPRQVLELKNGNFVILSYTSSFDQDFVECEYGQDKSLILLDSNGNTLFIKCASDMGIAGSPNAILESENGDFFMAGTATKASCMPLTNSLQNFWIAKLDAQWNLIWENCFGGKESDFVSNFTLTQDNGAVLIGTTQSDDGDVIGCFETWVGQYNIWVVKVDAQGNLQWQRCLGGSKNDEGYKVIEMGDGQLVVLSSIESKDGNVLMNNGNFDAWVAVLSKDGDLLSQVSLGGTSVDEAYDIQKMNNSEFAVMLNSVSAGLSCPNTNPSIYGDFLLYKYELKTNSLSEFENDFHVELLPNPAQSKAVLRFAQPFNGALVITDVFGNQYHVSSIHASKDFELDLSAYPSGGYFITLHEINGGAYSKKLMKVE